MSRASQIAACVVFFMSWFGLDYTTLEMLGWFGIHARSHGMMSPHLTWTADIVHTVTFLLSALLIYFFVENIKAEAMRDAEKKVREEMGEEEI